MPHNRSARALLCLFAALASAAPNPNPFRGTPLPVDPDADPLALNDPFLKLTEEELRTRWSSDSEADASIHADDAATTAAAAAVHPLAAKLASLDALRETIYVDVRLAGFDGDGEHQLRMGPEALQRLPDAASHEAAQPVAHPRPAAPSELPVKRRLIYKVTNAQLSLAGKIAKAVERSAVAGPIQTAGSNAVVPLSAVDELVRADYLRSRAGSHVTLYLLNPTVPRREPTAAEKAAAGVQQQQQQAADGAAADEPMWMHRTPYSYYDDGTNGTCPLTRWLGSGTGGEDLVRPRSERYIWVDLSAGPVAYGPASGVGLLTKHSLPSVISLARRFSTDQAALSNHLAVELSALCIHTGKLLLTPPIWWLPDRFYTSTTIIAIRVSDVTHHAADAEAARAAEEAQRQASIGGAGGAAAAAGAVGMATATARAAKDAAKQWASDLEVLRSQLTPLAPAGHTVSIEAVETSMGECRLCAAALHAATRTHTGIAPADASADGTSHGYVEFEQQHINSELLVKWLRKFVDELPGLHEREVKKGERILPLLLYSLPAERPILLDEGRTGRSSVAMPFEDLIIAIQTRPPPAVSADALAKAPSPPTMVLGEQCDGMPTILDAYDLKRPLLAALLQSGWGLAPSDALWSDAHKKALPNLLWSVGRTPFGPYSQRTELSFALRDAAMRTPLIALASEVFREIRSLRERFREFDKEVDEVLSPQEHLTFLRRLNVLSFKLQRATSYLSLQSYPIAQHYILSTWHDLKALRSVLAAAAKELQLHVTCGSA